MTKKAVFIFAIFLSLCLVKPAQAQQISAGTTYMIEVNNNWIKINTGTWMGETWFSIASSQAPDEWKQLEILEAESTEEYTMLKLPDEEATVKLYFLNEDQISLIFAQLDEPLILNVIERYGEPVERK